MTTITRAGLRALRRIQFGKELVPGTAVDATAFLVGKLGLKLEQEIYQPEDLETGRLASFERSIAIAREATLPFESDANYEQLMYFLSMAVNNFSNDDDRLTTGVPFDASTIAPYTWTYRPNYTKRNDPLSFTVEYGDDIQAFYSTFVSCRQLEFSGQVGDVVKINADLFGQSVTKLSRIGINVTITNAGSGYTSAPTVTFSDPPTGTDVATGTAVLNSSGEVDSVTITNAGSGYTSAPTVTFSDPPTGTDVATGTVMFGFTSGGGISSITVDMAGSGYTSAPTVAFTGGGGTGASAIAVLGDEVVSVTIVPGSGYTSVPTVTFSAPSSGGVRAIGRAIILNGTLESIEIIVPGSGYTSAPSIEITGGGGTGASATAELSQEVAFIRVTDPGSGYTSVPTVTFTGGGGTGVMVVVGFDIGVDPAGFTSGIAVPSELEPVLMGTAQLYSNMGIDGYSNLEEDYSEVASTLVDFNYRIMTGFNPMKYADNRLSYTNITEAKRHVELDMTVAFNREVNTWFDRFINQDYGWYSLTFDGTGSNSLALRVGGKITEYNELTEREGQNIVKLKIMSEYDSTDSVERDMEIILINSLNRIV